MDASAVVGQSFVYKGGGGGSERATGQREGVGCFKGEAFSSPEQTIKDMWVKSTNMRD